jgi:hypothetical protein
MNDVIASIDLANQKIDVVMEVRSYICGCIAVVISCTRLGKRLCSHKTEKTPFPHRSLHRCSAYPAASINVESSHACLSLVCVTNRSEDDLSTGLRQDGRPPSEQALCSRIDKLAIVVQDNLTEDDFHDS